jgi:hypothetical protein
MDFQTLRNIKAEDILIDSVCSCGVVIIYIMDKNLLSAAVRKCTKSGGLKM